MSKTYCKWAWRNTEGLFWKNSSPKIKHETLCNDYKGGGLKNIDILNKIISLQRSWIRRLYGNSFHEWKLIPYFLIKKSFGISFKFHANLFFKRNKVKKNKSFFHLSIGKSFYIGKKKPEFLSCILSLYLWYNKNIQVGKNLIYSVRFSEKNVNYISQLFWSHGSIRTWHELKTEYKLH